MKQRKEKGKKRREVEILQELETMATTPTFE
jgi:hypothetical protein